MLRAGRVNDEPIIVLMTYHNLAWIEWDCRRFEIPLEWVVFTD